nr:hypothetical protein [Mycobacterium shigaense]
MPAPGAALSAAASGYLDEVRPLGVRVEVAETIGRLWEAAARDQGADSDFRTVIRPFENAAGVTVGQANSPSSA